MANRYVRSTDGNDADNGSTWTLAKATLAGVAAIAVGGDVVWVSQNHAEATAAAVNLAWASNSPSAPIRILCGNDAAEPPTALATTGIVEVTGNNLLELSSIGGGAGDYLYWYGLTFRTGVGQTLSSSSITLNRGSGTQLYEDCKFHLAATGGSESKIDIVATAGFGETLCKNCNFQLSASAQTLNFLESLGVIKGGSMVAGVSPTSLVRFGESATGIFEGFDMSSMNAAMNLSASTDETNTLRVRNCKLPASWSGSVNSSTPGSGSVYELYNSDSTGTNYRSQRKTQFGIIDGETTVVRSGGASDGIRSISWKMVSNANPEWNHLTLDTEKILRWNNVTGSPITATIEILHDSVTNMTNQQIWLEVQYLGTSGSTLSSFVDDSSGDYLSTATDQADSSASWATTGLTNPNTQKLNVTFTPQEKGFISAVVRVAMASKTVYVCPKMEIS